MAATAYREPSPRWGHFSATIKGKLYVWGGRTKKHAKAKSMSSSVDIFDPILETWEAKSTSGHGHPSSRLYQGACAHAGRHLYLYGGTTGDKLDPQVFHKLDTTTLKWTPIPATEGPIPMKKNGCGMVSCGDQLFLFGGFGVRSDHTQPRVRFVQSFTSSKAEGWTNELHKFDTVAGESNTSVFSCAYSYVANSRQVSRGQTLFSFLLGRGGKRVWYTSVTTVVLTPPR